MGYTITFILALTVLSVSAGVPDAANQLFPEIISSLNYPQETHKITTSDGYINTYFRIQAKNTNIKTGLTPVYLQHGLLDSGDDWIINEEHLAPGLLLANSGYDVWIGNTRGNRYSQSHATYGDRPSSSSPYWDFSWQEISQYDLPAAFEYIANVTGKQTIHYVGHSQGTAIMFAALSRRDPTILKYLGQYHAAGPVAFVSKITSPLFKVLAESGLIQFEKFIDVKKFGFLTKLEREAIEDTCYWTQFICEDFIKNIADSSLDADNVDRLSVFVGHIPAGTSIQNTNYWRQLLTSKKFQMYDYGKKGNQQHYGQDVPPEYDLGQVNVPVYLHSGVYDELADPADVMLLHSKLTGSPNVQLNSYEYGHATFLWSTDTKFIDNVLNTLKGAEKTFDNEIEFIFEEDEGGEEFSDENSFYFYA